MTEVFRGIGARMLADFEYVHSQIKHPGERGSEREAALRQFLDSYLPTCYATSCGEIVDVTGTTSHQCDLIIYDPAKCPLLLSGSEYCVFPVEPILAVIEVKSVLDASELEDSVRKIRCVKQLKRDVGPILGMVFAYKSGYTKDPMDAIAARLQALNVGLAGSEYIDLLCVLDTGLIHLSGEDLWPRITKDAQKLIYHVWLELDLPVLLWFFIHLLKSLEGQTSSMPDYYAYARPGCIGVVRQMYPTPDT